MASSRSPRGRPFPHRARRRAIALGGAALAAVALAVAAMAVRGGATASSGATTTPSPYPAVRRAQIAFPLRVSKSKRYLVDRRGTPVLIVGDAPQSLIGNLGLASAKTYFADREAAGFDALWINLLCKKYTGCRDDGSTLDGIRPFTTIDDLGTPNPAYFTRARAMIREAAAAGMVVFLDPIETGGWLSTLRTNGPAKAFAYGRFLGRRFRGVPNIVWLNGNDFQNWRSPSDDALVLAVAKGIRSADHTHLQTVELDYPTSGSLDDERWRTVVSIDAAYSYRPTYARVTQEYGRRRFAPVIMAEASYEFEQNGDTTSPGDPQNLRRQEYWSALSGAAGQIYGNHYVWPFIDGWNDHLHTVGAVELGYLTRLLQHHTWYRLVPDTTHRVVVAGFGHFTSQGNVASSDYATTAAAPDGTVAMAYVPTPRTLTVAATRFAGPVTAQWYDPTTGSYRTIAGSPFPRKGRFDVTSPPRNASGDGDWVLVLTSPPHD